MLGQCLFRVVRDVESKVKKKRFRFIFFDKAERTIGNQLGEILIRLEYFRGSFIEIVIALPVKEKVIEIIDKSVSYSKELVETLFPRPMVSMRTDVPFTKECSAIAS